MEQICCAKKDRDHLRAEERIIQLSCVGICVTPVFNSIINSPRILNWTRTVGTWRLDWQRSSFRHVRLCVFLPWRQVAYPSGLPRLSTDQSWLWETTSIREWRPKTATLNGDDKLLVSSHTGPVRLPLWRGGGKLGVLPLCLTPVPGIRLPGAGAPEHKGTGPPIDPVDLQLNLSSVSIFTNHFLDVGHVGIRHRVCFIGYFCFNSSYFVIQI